MADSTIKFSIPLLGLLYNILNKSTKTVSDIASENVIEPTIHLVENTVENIEVFFHTERIFGFVFLLLVVIIILSYKLKK